MLCLVSWTLFQLGIKPNRYDGDFSFNILQKWRSFLNKRLNFWDSNPKGRFPLGEMSGDFAAKFILACAFLFVYSLAGEIFLFKIVKMDLSNSRRKNSPQLFDQSKCKYISIFVFSANTFQSDQIEGGC